jgi:hypothetical protein
VQPERTSIAKAARRLVGSGLALIITGLVMFYVLESPRSAPASDTFTLFSLAALCGGAIMWLIGSVLWAWRAAADRLFVRGVGLLVVSLLAGFLLQSAVNFHGWSALLILPTACAFIVGTLFLLTAMIRGTAER